MFQNIADAYKDVAVLVNSMTYNQSQFIENALNGFIIQKTDFPFVCFVMDDASADGAQKVIESFLERECDMSCALRAENHEVKVVAAKALDNPNCIIAAYLLRNNLYKQHDKKIAYLKEWLGNVKYEAFCEGDDYWTDSRKLQMQVDLLNSRPDVSLCYHPVKCLKPDGSYWINTYESIPVEAMERDIVKLNFVTTQSVMVRYDSSIDKEVSSLGKMSFGDYPTWLLYSQKGILYRLPDVMAVYRVGTGVWSTMSIFEQLFYSTVGYSKMYPLVRDENNKKAFDITIESFIQRALSEFDSIKNSRDYRLGHLILKPFRFVRGLFRK